MICRSTERPRARFFPKATLCALLTMLCFDAQAASELGAGKYYCFVSHMAGIQLDNNGQIYSGNIKPADDKFFIDIHLAIHPEKECSGPTDPSSFVDWWLCRANLEVQVGGGRRLRSDTMSFVGAAPLNGHFWLTSDGSFRSYQPDLVSSYISDGKCTKLSQN